MNIDNSKIPQKEKQDKENIVCACVIEKKEKKHEQTTNMNKTNKVRYTKKKTDK
jgi:hypothetical protein